MYLIFLPSAPLCETVFITGAPHRHGRLLDESLTLRLRNPRPRARLAGRPLNATTISPAPPALPPAAALTATVDRGEVAGATAGDHRRLSRRLQLRRSGGGGNGGNGSGSFDNGGERSSRSSKSPSRSGTHGGGGRGSFGDGGGRSGGGDERAALASAVADAEARAKALEGREERLAEEVAYLLVVARFRKVFKFTRASPQRKNL